MEHSLFSEGINLLMLGMGFVFVFLIFLVFATTFMSQLVTRFAPAPKPLAPKRSPSRPAAASDDNQLAAVMAAAIHHKNITAK